MNTPTFNLNLSFFDERDNLHSVKPSTNENMNEQSNFDTRRTDTGEVKTDTVTTRVSTSDDVFTSFFNELHLFQRGPNQEFCVMRTQSLKSYNSPKHT